MSRTSKTLTLTLAGASAAAASLAIAAVLSRLFSIEEYATYRQCLLVYNFASPLLGLGLASSLMYFVPRDPLRSRETLVNTLAILAITGATFALFALFVAPNWLSDQFNNPALAHTLPWVALLGIGMLFSSILAPFLLALGQTSKVALVAVATQALILGSVLTATFLFGTPLSAVIAQSIAMGAIGIASVALALRLSKGDFCLPNIGGAWQQLSFAVPLAIAVLLEGLAMGLDKILVSALCTPEEFAIFANGAMEIPFIGILTGSATAVIMPEIVRYFRDGEKAEAHRLWQRASVKTALLLFPIGGGLFLFAPELLTLLYSAQYADSATPFRLYLLLLPARAAFFGVIFQAAKRPDIILRRAIGTLVLNALVSYPLINTYGINGAAIGTLCVFWLYVIPHCVFYGSRQVGVPVWSLLPVGRLGRVGACTILGVCAGLWLKSAWESSILGILAAGTAYIFLVGISLRTLLPNETRHALAPLARVARVPQAI